ncbi:MAG: hypothetical protein EZS28_017523 [Streblomastix strix]|uniref:Uncharacterized protein n=1 Tax=Streblomastix strix TaxID=222440 RepID=A0A5J4VWR9_9EUKA|nr:MAG: hypothetical protein EZS28_017523 [Streblomastix strix]
MIQLTSSIDSSPPTQLFLSSIFFLPQSLLHSPYPAVRIPLLQPKKVSFSTSQQDIRSISNPKGIIIPTSTGPILISQLSDANENQAECTFKPAIQPKSDQLAQKKWEKDGFAYIPEVTEQDESPDSRHHTPLKITTSTYLSPENRKTIPVTKSSAKDERIWQRFKFSVLKKEEKKSQIVRDGRARELEGCTFTPNILDHSRSIAKQKKLKVKVIENKKKKQDQEKVEDENEQKKKEELSGDQDKKEVEETQNPKTEAETAQSSV